MHVISSNTYEPHRLPDPSVASPDLLEVDRDSENPPPPFMEDISSLVLPSVPPNISQKIQQNMECY